MTNSLPCAGRPGSADRDRMARPGARRACEDCPVQRLVTAELDLNLGASVDLVFQITAARGAALQSERLSFAQGERRYTATEIVDANGSRLHRFTGQSGPLHVRYDAVVRGSEASGSPTEQIGRAHV